MTRRIVVPDDCTMTQALGIVARTPWIWPRFVAFLARFGAQKAGFYCMCWSHGYRVSTIRRMARLETLTGHAP